MDESKTVAAYFAELTKRLAADGRAGMRQWPHGDRIIWYVVATRCEIDIDGFESVFEQLLSYDELQFLIAALNEVGAAHLAAGFRECRDILSSAGYVLGASGCRRIQDLGDVAAAAIAEVGRKIDAGQGLWSLDGRLARYVGSPGPKRANGDGATT